MYKFGIYIYILVYRNLQKRAKKARHEREKTFMHRISEAGCSTGEYVGDGRGEDVAMNEPPNDDNLPDELEPQVVEATDEEMECDGNHDKPLLILYDCETTGLSIYKDHITEIAAKVVNSPIPLDFPTFSSLVRSGRSISATGKFAKKKN